MNTATHICVLPTKFCSQERCVHVGPHVHCSVRRDLLHKDTQDKWEMFLKHGNCPEKCVFYRYVQIPMVTWCPWRAFQHSGLYCSNKYYKSSGFRVLQLISMSTVLELVCGPHLSHHQQLSQPLNPPKTHTNIYKNWFWDQYICEFSITKGSTLRKGNAASFIAWKHF